MSADFLEGLGPPHVCCIGALPFPLMIDTSRPFSLATGIREQPPKLRFQHFKVAPFENRTSISIAASLPTGERVRGLGTRVLLYLPLWEDNRKYYSHYLTCLGPNGLAVRNLARTIWGTKHAPSGKAHEALNSDKYEDNVNASVLPMFRRILTQFVDTYNLVGLFNERIPDTLPGVFTMLAPGRVSYRRPPLAVGPFMLQTHWIEELVSPESLSSALVFGNREFDRYQRQLLAMQKVAREGEPELAVIGSVTAIEWLLNPLVVANGSEVTIQKKAQSLSIRQCLEKPLKIAISDDLRKELIRAAMIRNDAVHGKPPQREVSGKTQSAKTVAELFGLVSHFIVRFSDNSSWA